ncbi:MAG: transcription-repair coupling factor [Deltaproteobacteria bacterium]|nr:transcription-repair coupling factor [Deltaproteobacteria bacterium]
MQPSSSLQDLFFALARESSARMKPPGCLEICGAPPSLGAAIAAYLAQAHENLVLYVVADEDECDARRTTLDFFLGAHQHQPDDPLAPSSAMSLPAVETSPHAEVQPDRRATMDRLALLCRLASGLAPSVLVASAAGLFRRVIPPAPFSQLCGTVTAGTALDRDALVRDLLRGGFARVAVVDDPGTFAVRGSVIDVFCPLYRHPTRIELDADRVESLRLFDAATQRTLRPIDRLLFHAVRETVATQGSTPRQRVLEAADRVGYPSSKTRSVLEHIEAGEEFFGIEALAPVFHERMACIFEYLPPNTVVVVEEPHAVLEQVRRGMTRLRESAKLRQQEHRLALEAREFLLDESEAHSALSMHPRIEIHSVEIEPAPVAQETAARRIRVSALPTASLRAELLRQRGENDIGPVLARRLRAWADGGSRVGLVAPSRGHADRLAALLSALGLSPEIRRDAGGLAWLRQDQGPALSVLVGPLACGFALPSDRLVLIAEEEVFGPRAHRLPPPVKASSFGDLSGISEGDLVVHDEHGVGRYRGLAKLTLRGVAQDFLHLEYSGGTLYLPVYRVSVIHRFVGGSPETVRLDKLGGATWTEKRRRVSAATRKMAEELLQLYAQRRALPGHAFPPPDAIFGEFEATFAFDETADQERAIGEVLADMQADTPMDRLVCGDVGYGKTEVALRAALLAVLGGQQVALLAPTTVLVEQHYVTFRERFRDFPVHVAALSRFRKPAEQKAIARDIELGMIDVVIGTHRLLSRDVRFKRLGLLVIDEEQRFGVSHKERLKAMRSQVEVLTLTATPIPRTLQMGLAGLLEISVIATPPADRLAIRTFACHFDPALLGEAIAKELARGGQVFFVHNRIEDLAKWTKEIRAIAPSARVAMAHGQMGERQLEKVMIDFVDGHYDILCCTSIIESGLDIPRANTMIVNQADRFGLAQLYQLRGRIGRSRERAYCYLVVPDDHRLGKEATQRLAVLQRFAELGAGFQIATADLEIRGAGELLGAKQSGLLAAVGFDTYARLLEEAVAELRGQPIKPELDPEITVDVPAFLPDDYIPDPGQRLELYRRLAQASGEDDVRAIAAEIEDRYGRLPDEAQLLCEVMVDKTLVRSMGARGYELGPARMLLSLGPEPRLEPAKVMRLVQRKNSLWRLTPDMHLSYAFTEKERGDRMAAARARIREVAACTAQKR